ncbi:MAG: hypothetical protein MJE66_06215 [Proteobacteria bacterium]|nr:hypothetical protein [Pseudomonadota bacterium]
MKEKGRSNPLCVGFSQRRWRDIVVTSLRSVVLLPLVFWRCFRMPRRWPWSEFDTYLDVPLAEIRREYGIRIRVP